MKKIVVCVLLTLMLCFLAQPLVQVLLQVQVLPLVQALPDDAHTPLSSRRRSRLSPSIPSKQKFTLLGRRFSA